MTLSEIDISSKFVHLDRNISSNTSLVIIQQYLTNYGMTTYFTFGNIGLLFNIAIFSQHRNSFSLYILTMSICAFIGLYISVITIIYISYHPNLVISSPVYCQLQFYFRHSFNQMMRSFFIFACADRYAISSNNLRIRSFSRYYVAIRVIVAVILFWLLLFIFPTTLIRSLEDGRCVVSTALNNSLFSMYLLLVLGIIPLGSMIIFTVLLYINLKNIRGRIQPVINVKQPINQLLRKRDRDMIRILLIEVICYIITTIPLIIMFTYQSITIELIKNTQRLQIESFFAYFTDSFLLYMNNCLSFWLYICTSRSFRLEFKNLIRKIYGFITRKQMRMHEIN